MLTLLWYGAGGGVAAGPLVDPEQAGEKTEVGGGESARESVKLLISTDGKESGMTDK